MSEVEATSLENGVNESEKAAVHGNENTGESCDVVLKQEGESLSPCQESSPKNRRKISKPKHYKPTADEGGDDEHNDGTSEDPNGSANSPESVIQEQGNEVIPENAVHVMTSGAKEAKPSSPLKRAASSQKPKRPPTYKSTGKKQKHDIPTVPRKPEDLIKEAMLRGKPNPPANKRDAQYRKSYAYKIWKERGNLEVESEVAEERNGKSELKTKLPPGLLQNQARASFFWPANQYKGTSPPGFFANGKYYAIPPQMIPAIHGGPQIPQTSAPVPQIGKAAVTVATSVRAVPSSVIQSSTAGVVSPGQQRAQFPGVDGSSGIENGRRDMTKVGPPNVTVVPQYPAKENLSTNAAEPTVISPGIKSPGIQTPPLAKPPMDTQVPISLVPVSHADAANETPPRRPSQTERGSPVSSSEMVERKANNVSASPSNLVSLMKTSLRQKHSKENVQPLPNMFKSKRKLPTEKNDGPAAKKAGKPTIFTPLNEHEAEKLANDIYDVNLEYFPFQTLAEKAAQSEEKLPKTPESSEKTNKVKEIEKVRCLLKDFYDITFSCAEDPDMQKFDSASRKFGRKNILNHLSLLDRYFAELQKKLDI